MEVAESLEKVSVTEVQLGSYSRRGKELVRDPYKAAV
jgi:hypothetical protein